MQNSRRNRKLAVLILLCFCTLVLSSYLYLIRYTRHICTGDRCPICQHLQESSAALRRLACGGGRRPCGGAARRLLLPAGGVFLLWTPHATLWILHTRLND